MMKIVTFILASLCAVSQCAVNPVKKPIEKGREVHVQRFSKIEKIGGRGPKIQGITVHDKDLYVTTGTSGGFIYRITPNGEAKRWFDVAGAMESNGRQMNFENGMHGGLRAVAFHPKFKKNGFFYVSLMETRTKDPSNFRYLSKPTGNHIRADSVVLEFKVDKKTKKPVVGSLREVIRVGMPIFDHPIKQMVFHKRFLYIGHGDGSFQSALVGGGQNNDGLGKIIRIDPLKKGKNPYRIPKDNPYRKNSKFMDELYAIGFRNPHNLCFSKKGELFVTDAGRDNVEEVNIVKPGQNYGWSLREGAFVHLSEGGILKGIAPLPDKDDKKLTYPNVVVGHVGNVGDKFVGQALAGACPVENKSAMKNTFLYANFPSDGNLYYSFLDDMRKAKVTGPNDKLTQATTYKASILFDHDDDPKTPPLKLENLRDVIRKDPGFGGFSRADIRFGRGAKGEIYFSSKANGGIYLISSTLPGFKEK